MNATPATATGPRVIHSPGTPPRTQSQRWADEQAAHQQQLDDLWEAEHAHLSTEDWMMARENREF